MGHNTDYTDRYNLSISHERYCVMVKQNKQQQKGKYSMKNNFAMPLNVTWGKPILNMCVRKLSKIKKVLKRSIVISFCLRRQIFLPF